MTSTILVVDDDFDVRDALAEILRDEGFEVATASDGNEALAWLRSQPPPGLILLDWMMPRCNGAQFRAQQQADPRLAAIPVVLLTADLRLTEKPTSVGALHILSKPVTLERLLEVVGRFVPPRAPR